MTAVTVKFLAKIANDKDCAYCGDLGASVPYGSVHLHDRCVDDLNAELCIMVPPVVSGGVVEPGKIFQAGNRV